MILKYGENYCISIKLDVPDTFAFHFKVLFAFQKFIWNKLILQSNSQNSNQLPQLQHQSCGPVWTHPLCSSNWEALTVWKSKIHLRCSAWAQQLACFLWFGVFFKCLNFNSLNSTLSTLLGFFFHILLKSGQKQPMFSVMKS